MPRTLSSSPSRRMLSASSPSSSMIRSATSSVLRREISACFGRPMGRTSPLSFFLLVQCLAALGCVGDSDFVVEGAAERAAVDCTDKQAVLGTDSNRARMRVLVAYAAADWVADYARTQGDARALTNFDTGETRSWAELDAPLPPHPP